MRLLQAAQRAVSKMYEHVRDEGRRLRDESYLPQYGQHAHEYMQIYYLRQMHAQSSLCSSDYALLAHRPAILGAAVFGTVEAAGAGWRWTFAPAGVAVEGPVCVERAEASQQLAALQATLYPEAEAAGGRISGTSKRGNGKTSHCRAELLVAPWP